MSAYVPFCHDIPEDVNRRLAILSQGKDQTANDFRSLFRGWRRPA